MTDEFGRYGPYPLHSATEADGGIRPFIPDEALEESGIEPDGWFVVQPYKNGIHLIASDGGGL